MTSELTRVVNEYHAGKNQDYSIGTAALATATILLMQLERVQDNHRRNALLAQVRDCLSTAEPLQS